LKPLHKYILQLAILNLLLPGIGFILVLTDIINISVGDLAILSLSFSVIALITLVIFFKGQSKEPDSRILYSMVSISLKLLLEMVLALVWFILAKKTSFSSLLTFFVLYLTFTLFSIWAILRTLKNKSL